MKYIVSAIGMTNVQIEELERRLNNKKSKKQYFVFDKPISIQIIVEEKKHWWSRN